MVWLHILIANNENININNKQRLNTLEFINEYIVKTVAIELSIAIFNAIISNLIKKKFKHALELIVKMNYSLLSILLWHQLCMVFICQSFVGAANIVELYGFSPGDVTSGDRFGMSWHTW